MERGTKRDEGMTGGTVLIGTEDRPISVDEFLKLDEAGTFEGVESIDGRILELAPRDRAHASELYAILRDATLGLEVLPAILVRLGDRHLPEGDLAVAQVSTRDLLSGDLVRLIVENPLRHSIMISGPSLPCMRVTACPNIGSWM